MVGIVAYGAYVPRLRLNRQAVYDANKWFAAGLRGLAKGERSMANWDEDSITMAVEASRDCLTSHKAEDVRKALAAHCPQGIDVYFDNVGGEILDAALARLALRARVVI